MLFQIQKSSKLNESFMKKDRSEFQEYSRILNGPFFEYYLNKILLILNQH